MEALDIVIFIAVALLGALVFLVATYGNLRRKHRVLEAQYKDLIDRYGKNKKG